MMRVFIQIRLNNLTVMNMIILLNLLNDFKHVHVTLHASNQLKIIGIEYNL